MCFIGALSNGSKWGNACEVPITEPVTQPVLCAYSHFLHLKVSPVTEMLRWLMFFWVTSRLSCSFPKILKPIRVLKKRFPSWLENSFAFHLLQCSTSWTSHSSTRFWKTQTRFPSCVNQGAASFWGRLEVRPIVHLHCVTFPQLKRKSPLKCVGWRLCFLPL